MDGTPLKINGIASAQIATVINDRNLMKKSFKKYFLSFVATAAVAFASVDSLYEIDGSAFNERNRTKGPKALVNVGRSMGKDNIAIERHDPHIGYIIQDSIHISLKKSEQWIEMEKNADYSVCVDDSKGGIWKVKNFSYTKESENCIRLNSGNYVKSAKIQYATRMGNGYTFNLLVGMKYIDLRGKKHLLGYNGKSTFTRYGKVIYYDSLRHEEMDEVLAVDKYKVTECEFVQMLWDSIPAQMDTKDRYDNYDFWIQKKKSMVKNGYCAARDSAATQVFLHHALVYANNRSIRDGLQPVYRLEGCDFLSYGDGFKKDGSFGVGNATFFDIQTSVCVHINKDANGYRLPNQDEWMALARAGENYRHYIWGRDEDSTIAAQYAWFGVRDPEDKYLKMSMDDPFERGWLESSCGQWLQKSRPVGMLKPNAYGLYDMVGLVCENVIAQRSVDGNVHSTYCKGGFLTDSLKALNFGSYCSDYNKMKQFQGLRLVRQIK